MLSFTFFTVSIPPIDVARNGFGVPIS
jgi:hypothetical protein